MCYSGSMAKAQTEVLNEIRSIINEQGFQSTGDREMDIWRAGMQLKASGRTIKAAIEILTADRAQVVNGNSVGRSVTLVVKGIGRNNEPTQKYRSERYEVSKRQIHTDRKLREPIWASKFQTWIEDYEYYRLDHKVAEVVEFHGSCHVPQAFNFEETRSWLVCAIAQASYARQISEQPQIERAKVAPPDKPVMHEVKPSKVWGATFNTLRPNMPWFKLNPPVLAA